MNLSKLYKGLDLRSLVNMAGGRFPGRQILRSVVALLIAGGALVPASCSGLLQSESDNNSEELALLSALGLAATLCDLGGTTFSIAGVSCGVAPSGTGTLTALSNKTDLISVQLSFLLNSAGSSISVVGGLNPSVGVATSGVGAEIQVTPTTAKLPADPGAGTTGPGVAAATFCVELHLEESPPHVILDKANCTPKLTSSVSYENDANSPARQGGLWGFVLNDATITGLTVNTSENFTD